MRWDHLKRDPDAETASLPGMRDPAVVRRFDAPEALDTRFYEIEAKTVLNRVPGRSRMPFGWTVNPYRGCSHACTYCLDPATPVLLANGRTRAIGELEPGDAIVGTRREGRYRRYVETHVADRWSTRKPAFRVTFEDGTEIVASGDHRFLTTRGWKHVTGVHGPGQALRADADVLLGPGLHPITDGTEVADGGRRVTAIEAIGVRDLVDVTTGTGDFVAAGAISHNCFARPTHEYLNFGPGRDFEREIVVKVNAPERLRADLAKRARTPAWGDTVALGTNTDPYQWVESKYRLLPGIWEALRDARVPASVLTKSPLLLRDLDLMLQVQETAGFEAALSVPSLDEKAWRSTEPHTPHPRTRLAAVAELTRVGIPTAVLAAPLMPGINDAPEQIERLLAACTEAGAISVRGIGLHLRGTTRDVFLEWLADARPDLVPLYEELYRDGPHLPRQEAARLAQLVQHGERWGERVVRSDVRPPDGRGGEAVPRRPASPPGEALPFGEAPEPPRRRPPSRWGDPPARPPARDAGRDRPARRGPARPAADQLPLF